MVGHLLVHDGTVVIHVKHGDLITDVLAFGLGRKDLLGEGPHFIIGLCRAQQWFVQSITQLRSAPRLTLQPQTQLLDAEPMRHEHECRMIHGERTVHTTSYTMMEKRPDPNQTFADCGT